MNDIIKIENGHLAAQTIEYIRATEARMKKEKEEYDAFKAELLKAMEQNGVVKIDTDEVLINYVVPTNREAFDSKSFKDDFPDLYDHYVKISPVKASVRIKVK